MAAPAILSPAAARRRAVLLLGAVFAVGTAAGVGALASLPPPLDDRQCRSDQPLASSTVVVVDTSDALNAVQTETLQAAIREARETSPKYGRVTLLLMDSNKPFEPVELVSLCNPGSAGQANALFETIDRVDQRWQTSFSRPVDEAAAAAARREGSSASPIMQTITAATWREDFSPRVRSRTLILVSDLLQQEPGGFTAYRTGALWPRYEKSLAGRVPAQLGTVSVKVRLLHRSEATELQTAALTDFWARWFADRGAGTVDFGAAPSPPPLRTAAAAAAAEG